MEALARAACEKLFACGDLRLQSQLVTWRHIRLGKGLVVEQLRASAAMVQFVAHQLAIGAIEWQVHALHQDSEDAVDGDVVRCLDFVDAAAGDVGNFDSNVTHKISGRL